MKHYENIQALTEDTTNLANLKTDKPVIVTVDGQPVTLVRINKAVNAYQGDKIHKGDKPFKVINLTPVKAFTPVIKSVHSMDLETAKRSAKERHDNGTVKPVKTLTEARTEAKERFKAMVTAYENSVNGVTPGDYDTAVYTLCTAIVQSVLKKYYNVSGSQFVDKMKRELNINLKDLENIARLTDSYNIDLARDVITNTDSKGENIENNDNGDEIIKLLKNPLSDALGLVHDCFNILTDLVTEHCKNSPVSLEKEFDLTVYNRKVWIIKLDNENLYKTITTSIIKECYRGIKRKVVSEKKQAVNNAFNYIEKTIDNSKIQGCIYIRKEKGTEINSEWMLSQYDWFVNAVCPSEQQAKILAYRLCGYGKKAIATVLNMRVDNVKLQLKRLQNKITLLGLDNDKALAYLYLRGHILTEDTDAIEHTPVFTPVATPVTYSKWDYVPYNTRAYWNTLQPVIKPVTKPVAFNKIPVKTSRIYELYRLSMHLTDNAVRTAQKTAK